MDENMRMSFQEQQRRQEEQRAALEKEQRKGGAVFGRLAFASLLYTLVYTLCLYKNISGLATLLFVVATLGYVKRVLSTFGMTEKKDSIFVAAVMCLLGISTFLTGNLWIIGMNYAAFFLLLVALLLHNFGSDAHWDIGKYLGEIFVSVCGAIGCIAKPFTDGSAFYRNRKREKNGKAQYIVIGIGMAIPCLFFLGTLLMSADMVFASMVQKMFSAFYIPRRVVGITFMLCFGFLSSYCGVRFVEKHAAEITVADKKKCEPLVAMTGTLPIAVLYLVFSMIQITYLFVGNMELPEGVTYAEYARSGFFQLLIVCVLNLVLVLAVKKYFKEHKLLNIILLVISGCTYVMTASSACRMLLYIKAYQLTFLRITVLAALAVIALLMAGVVGMIVKPQFPLFRYGVVVVSVMYLLFSFSHVDYFIASYNLAHVQEQDGSGNFADVDYAYIYTLSTDAAPAIADYIEETGKVPGWYMDYCRRNRQVMEDSSIRGFNVSHYIAGRRLNVR